LATVIFTNTLAYEEEGGGVDDVEDDDGKDEDVEGVEAIRKRKRALMLSSLWTARCR
jgi:hypothetical protein